MNIEQTICEYVDKTVHMSLATTRGNPPWICEVHFVYDDNLNLYFRSLKSRRHSQEIAENQQVAGNIVRQHDLGEAPHAIYFEGTAKLMDDAAEREKVFPFFRDRLGASDAILEEAGKPDGHQFYKITVATWYAFGKFGGDRSQKFELAWKGGER